MACRRIVYYVGKAALGVHFNADLSEDSNELQSKKNEHHFNSVNYFSRIEIEIYT